MNTPQNQSSSSDREKLAEIYRTLLTYDQNLSARLPVSLAMTLCIAKIRTVVDPEGFA